MSECKIRPLHDNIVVRQSKQEAVTSGGIVLPDNIDEKPYESVVLAVGPGIKKPLSVQVGDTILSGQYVGQATTIDDVDYLILNEDEIIAILV